MDLNDVTAGKYQLVSPRWDQITSKPGEPLDYIRHRRGDIVELNAEDAKRLVAAGAVVKPGALEKAKAEQARELAERAAADYRAILAGLPEDVRSEVAPETVPQTPQGGDGSDTGGGDRVEDVLASVGNDADKAQAALDAEKAKDKPRSTLIAKLEDIVAAAAGA